LVALIFDDFIYYAKMDLMHAALYGKVSLTCVVHRSLKGAAVYKLYER